MPAKPTVHQLLQTVPVSCHAWNGDRTQVAVSPNNSLVYIYQKQGNTFFKTHELKEHDQRITSIDWAPKSNLIVTCAEDRNAYVWKLDNGKWTPGLVVLRINRAATCVKWSPSEEKFAIGSGARIVSICYFQEENDWWVAKHIKADIRSTVTSLDWHPSNNMLAIGCSDFTARIYSAAVKGVDKRPEANTWAEAEKFKSFGHVLRQFDNEGNGWVHDVAFSPNGETLGWVSHNSTIAFATASDSAPNVVFEQNLPKRAIIFISNEKAVAAGHDCVPVLYTKKGNSWGFAEVLDLVEDKGAGVTTAMSRFKQMDLASQETSDTRLFSTHQNAINQLSKVKISSGNVSEFSSSGQDGKLVLWSI